jgi:NtrC-family two-component system response regulator AlgB
MANQGVCSDVVMHPESRSNFGLHMLVVDRDPRERDLLRHWLAADGYHVWAGDTIEGALSSAGGQTLDVVFLGRRLGTRCQIEAAVKVRAESPWTRIVVIAAGVDAMEQATKVIGPCDADFIMSPATCPQVQFAARLALQQRESRRHADALRTVNTLPVLPPDMTSANPARQRALELARQVAPSQAAVLIRGEAGVGKRWLGRMIHRWSTRVAAPFAVARCGHVGADALEVELFGESEGRSSGADGVCELVSLCGGGTLMLEEIGRAPLSLQPKLLRLLRDREYERRGEWRERLADVRIVATSSIDLLEAAERGQFRRDLLMTLESVTVDLPPLREHPEDIGLLARQCLAFFVADAHLRIAGFTAEAMQLLQQYSWPGNIRELRNLVERAVLLCKGSLVDVEHLPPDLLAAMETTGITGG